MSRHELGPCPKEVSLTPPQEEAKPASLVLEADLERRLLMQEAAELAAKTEASDYTPTAEEQKRSMDVHERLISIDAAVGPGCVRVCVCVKLVNPDDPERLKGAWFGDSTLET